MLFIKYLVVECVPLEWYCLFLKNPPPDFSYVCVYVYNVHFAGRMLQTNQIKFFISFSFILNGIERDLQLILEGASSLSQTLLLWNKPCENLTPCLNYLIWYLLSKVDVHVRLRVMLMYAFKRLVNFRFISIHMFRLLEATMPLYHTYTHVRLV